MIVAESLTQNPTLRYFILHENQQCVLQQYRMVMGIYEWVDVPVVTQTEEEAREQIAAKEKRK